eukprot:SAG25_NODE_8775_length_405_cov_0.581699_1_plen_32_part_01
MAHMYQSGRPIAYMYYKGPIAYLSASRGLITY